MPDAPDPTSPLPLARVLDRAPPTPASAVVEPVDRALLALLRRAVIDHAGTERRRVHPSVVHVGVPGALVATLPLGDQRLDHALRVDAVEAMVRRTRRPGPPPVVWLVRAGTADPRDIDLAWSAAARAAAAELDQALPMVVVTRRGWHDPETGVGRTWTRVVRGPAAGGGPAAPAGPPPAARRDQSQV